MADKLVIGLTGGIGSGKTAAADYFQKLGVNIVDADIAARKVVEPGQPALDELVKHFGPDILNHPYEVLKQKVQSQIVNH